MTTSAVPSYAGCCFPAEVISHAVWPCFHVPLSPRMADGLLAARGIAVSHGWAAKRINGRQRALKLGQAFANQTRRRLPAAGDGRHLDGAVPTTAGVRHRLWRATDRTASRLHRTGVPDSLVQGRRDTQAAKRLPRELQKRQCRALRVMATDKLASCGAAQCEVMPSVGHRRHKGLNNRAENLHQPTRRREQQARRFKSPGQAQRFLSAYDGINNLFHLRRHQVPAIYYRAAKTRAFQVWAEVTGVATRA